MQALQSRIDSFQKTKRVKRYPGRPSSSTASLKWPHPAHFSANPNTLAEAGFFFDPSWDDRDSVACFFCGKELSDWDEDDDPFQIHYSKCQNSCAWAVVRCGLTDDLDEDGRYGTPVLHSHLNCSLLPIASCSEPGPVCPRPKPWKRLGWKHSARIGGPMTNNPATLQRRSRYAIHHALIVSS